MQRLSSDRGAVAVMTALLLVPLLVCAALVVDIGVSYVQRRQLQNFADAAALAIAQDCGNNKCTANYRYADTVYDYRSNGPVGATTTTSPSDGDVPNGNMVTVTARSTFPYLFAPVIGIHNNTVVARATASWGAPTGGQSVLPLTISWCSFKAQTGGGIPTGSTPVTISTTKNDRTNCTGPSGNAVSGGFGWVDVDPGGDCIVTSIITGELSSKPGAPPSCPDLLINAQIGKTVLLPIFGSIGQKPNGHDATGTNASYVVYAYAAFHLTNFYSKGNDSSITGFFTQFVELSDAFTYGTGSPDLGARVVTLTA